VLRCLYDVLLHAECDDAVFYAEAALVAANLVGLGTSGRILVVCHCYREEEESIVRIISARKADREEQRQYRWWIR
jgi:uncharacterized DUF497 family protein